MTNTNASGHAADIAPAQQGDNDSSQHNTMTEDQIYGRIGAPLNGSYNLGLHSLHKPYKMVLRISYGLRFLPLFIGLIILDVVLASKDLVSFGGIMAVGAILWLGLIIILPARIYRRWGYAMEQDRLRVLRGFLFRTDTVVPFNRIQHLDVSQGPIERLNNVAKLIVHTAGTHNSIVVLPGLEPQTADEMREEIRSHIREEMI